MYVNPIKPKIVFFNSHLIHHSYAALSSETYDLLTYIFFFFSLSSLSGIGAFAYDGGALWFHGADGN